MTEEKTNANFGEMLKKAQEPNYDKMKAKQPRPDKPNWHEIDCAVRHLYNDAAATKNDAYRSHLIQVAAWLQHMVGQ